MAGRKTKLNSARQCAICEVMKHGGTFRAAAAAAGICESTLHDWRKYGDDDEAGVYGRFVAALERALGEGESAAVGAVYRAFTEPALKCRPKASRTARLGPRKLRAHPIPPSRCDGWRDATRNGGTYRQGWPLAAILTRSRLRFSSCQTTGGIAHRTGALAVCPRV